MVAKTSHQLTASADKPVWSLFCSDKSNTDANIVIPRKIAVYNK